MAVLPRLDDLARPALAVGLDRMAVLDRILHRQKLGVEGEHRGEELCPLFHAPPPVQVRVEPPHPTLGQIRARGMSDDEVPALIAQLQYVAELI